MHRKPTTINTPRLSLYKPRQCRNGGERSGQYDFGRRVTNRHGAAATGRPVNSGLAFVRCGQPARPVPSAPESPSETSVLQEMLRGAAIGMIACLCLVWLAGGSPLSFVAAVVWGSSFGALIGMLLWIGSAAAEDPVLPPAPGQARGEKPEKPRQRR